MALQSYAVLAVTVVVKTSTEIAPWTLIPANDKRFARVAVVEAMADRMAEALG